MDSDSDCPFNYSWPSFPKMRMRRKMGKKGNTALNNTFESVVLRVAVNVKSLFALQPEISQKHISGMSMCAVSDKRGRLLKRKLLTFFPHTGRLYQRWQTRDLAAKCPLWQACFTVHCGTIKLKLDFSHYTLLLTGTHCSTACQRELTACLPVM